MAQSAFAEIRRYLDYKPVAKWAALVAAILSGLLFICFLFLLGLAIDLLINQGSIPTYRKLTPPQQACLSSPQRSITTTSPGLTSFVR